MSILFPSFFLNTATVWKRAKGAVEAESHAQTTKCRRRNVDDKNLSSKMDFGKVIRNLDNEIFSISPSSEYGKSSCCRTEIYCLYACNCKRDVT